MLCVCQIVLVVGVCFMLFFIFGVELVCIFDDVFDWDMLFVLFIIVGGGVIVVEMVFMLVCFGVWVIVLMCDVCVLFEFDVMVVEVVVQLLVGCGVELIQNVDVVCVECDVVNGGGVIVYVSIEGSDVFCVLCVQCVLSVIGCMLNVVGFGLDVVGVMFDVYGCIVVDCYFCMCVCGVYVVGDICGVSCL